MDVVGVDLAEPPSATSVAGRWNRRPKQDRNVFLILTALVWVGVLSGFGTDSYKHIIKYGFDYPLIVHFHAVVFVSFLVIFTTQVALIRVGRPDVHRRLGAATAVLICAMLALGPLTAVIVDTHQFETKGQTPEFLAVQFADMVAFGVLAGAGLLLRKVPAAHRRLMMLALIYISDAGFARLINESIAAPLGDGVLADMVELYLGSDVLLLGLGAYDYITRRALHPAYVAGALWMIIMQATALTGLHSPAWKSIALRLIGHGTP